MATAITAEQFAALDLITDRIKDAIWSAGSIDHPIPIRPDEYEIAFDEYTTLPDGTDPFPEGSSIEVFLDPSCEHHEEPDYTLTIAYSYPDDSDNIRFGSVYSANKRTLLHTFPYNKGYWPDALYILDAVRAYTTVNEHGHLENESGDIAVAKTELPNIYHVTATWDERRAQVPDGIYVTITN